MEIKGAVLISLPRTATLIAVFASHVSGYGDQRRCASYSYGKSTADLFLPFSSRLRVLF